MTRDGARWTAAVVVCLGVFLLGMDLTVLNVALPDLDRDLKPSMAQIQWIVDAYALVLGGIVLTAGALTDRIGRRRAFTLGLVVCGTTSALGALAEEPGWLIAARCGMGAGAALLMPATLSIISNLFTDPAPRRRAIAVWAAALGLGGMTGPVLGGALVETFSWRAGFWVNVPLVAVTLILTLLAVPKTGSSRTGGHSDERVDLLGALLSACGLLTLVWTVIESPVKGWTSPPVLTGFTLAAALLTVFVAHQRRRAEHAMLPLPLLRLPGVMRGATSLTLLSFAMYGALFVITLYLQGVLGYTPGRPAYARCPWLWLSPQAHSQHRRCWPATANERRSRPDSPSSPPRSPSLATPRPPPATDTCCSSKSSPDWAPGWSRPSARTPSWGRSRRPTPDWDPR